MPHRAFRGFWASGTGWGEFTYAPGTSGSTFFTLRVLAGKLRCRSVRVAAAGVWTRMRVGEREYPHSAAASDHVTLFTAEETIVIGEGDELRIEARA
jgi:hypothetical protein